MRIQLIFCIETDEHCKSDQIYIKDTIERFFNYDNSMDKFSYVFMGGKGNYKTKVYMAFQKGTQTAPHGGIMPPQAGISTAGNGNSGCAGRRLTVAGHGGIMNPLLLMYKTGQRWRAT